MLALIGALNITLASVLVAPGAGIMLVRLLTVTLLLPEGHVAADTLIVAEVIGS